MGHNGDSYSSMSDANNNSSSEAEDDNEDEDDVDFLGKKKSSVYSGKTNKARGYNKQSVAGGGQQQRKYKPRRTVKSLTEAAAGLLPFDECDFTSYVETDELNDGNSVASALSKRSRHTNLKVSTNSEIESFNQIFICIPMPDSASIWHLFWPS